MEANQDPKKSTPGAVPPKKPTWTIMVYIVADGTLANFAVMSLKQLNEVASKAGDDQLKVVVGAQFSFPIPVTKAKTVGDTQTIEKPKPHLLLKGGSGKDPEANNTIEKVLALASKTESAKLSQGDALQHFLESVDEDTACDADRYALILWDTGLSSY